MKWATKIYQICCDSINFQWKYKLKTKEYMCTNFRKDSLAYVLAPITILVTVYHTETKGLTK